MMEAISTQVINILLVDDHAMFRQGLARVLEKEPGFKWWANSARPLMLWRR